MISLNVVICEHDTSYAQALSHYLMTVKSHQFSVNLFSIEKHLQDYLQNNCINVLLISEEVYNSWQKPIKADLTILLVENLISTQHLQLPCIEKYQRMQEIVYQIISQYTTSSLKEVSHSIMGGGTQLIGVYSPTGGSGKTTISLGLAKELAIQGNSTLFISLEPIPSYTNLLGAGNGGSISDLFYYVSLKTENLLMKLEGIQGYDEDSGLFYLPPPINPNDMLDLPDSDWLKMIEFIFEKGNYSFIVIDFTSNWSKINSLLIEKCNKKVFLLNHDLKCYWQLDYIRKIRQSININLEDYIFVLNHNKPSINYSEELGRLVNINYEIPYIESLYPHNEGIKIYKEGGLRVYLSHLMEVIQKIE